MLEQPTNLRSAWLPLLGLILFAGMLVMPEAVLAGYFGDLSYSVAPPSFRKRQAEILLLCVGILFLLFALLGLVRTKRLTMRLVGPVVLLLLGSSLILYRFLWL